MIESINRHISNIAGWRSKRRIVVIESDDWGSIRMPSLAAYKRLDEKGVTLGHGNSLLYNKLDTLAGPDDLDHLFNTIRDFKDSNGRTCVFTAMALSANPDFERIREDNFQHYHYEPFPVSLAKYNLEKSLEYWRSGIIEGIFIPQFHGREHLNVSAWMRALQRKDAMTLHAFNEGFWGFRNKQSSSVNFQAAFDLEFKEDLEYQATVIESGLELFEKIHGYRASFFVPPNGPFNNDLAKTAVRMGIQSISTPKIQQEPLGSGTFRKNYFYLGKKGINNLTYLVRNCFFEPHQQGPAAIDKCLAQISTAFFWGKPAIISTHRINYVGQLDEQNRIKNLALLSQLLQQMLKRWPDVIFMTSPELTDAIKS